MRFDYCEAFGTSIPDAYERLLLNAMLGDASLFARNDEVESAWRVVMPILDTWAREDERLARYLPGSWGPRAFQALLQADGREWCNPE
jgi:glucose-6-phosphate 1-dehydrogenase